MEEKSFVERVNYPHKDPGCCVICQNTNPGTWCDTRRDLDFGVVTPLNGRKYVCQECGETIAQIFGFEHPDRIWHLEEMVTNMNVELTETKAELSKCHEHMTKNFFEMLDKLGYVPKPRPRGRPPKKKTEEVE